jgi:hypothetical protein
MLIRQRLSTTAELNRDGMMEDLYRLDLTTTGRHHHNALVPEGSGKRSCDPLGWELSE